MAEPPQTHEGYQIGVICALATEKAAMVAMLDETHPKLQKKDSDENEYTAGRIGVHNIVIACLPAGVMGIGPAAVVANNMRRSFPIKFGLMVGVGGGVWSTKNDIRLGDIVVSQPTGTHGGVVQWDFGKKGKGGEFRRTGSLDKPPRVLLHALQELKTFDLIDGVDIKGALALMVENKPRMGKTFLYQGADHDQLFKATYDHKGNETCDECDPKLTVQRPVRSDSTPQIHYGNIASGNEVMKHGTTRDRIAQEEGVVCFEMEAAGLMDNFPCLVIRGICDYADSHKNKIWQPYAAATAAAFARVLLGFVDKQQVNKPPQSIAPFIVPFDQNLQFTGRVDQLIELEGKLFVGEQTSKIAITGLGGVGKTQVVLELAYRTRAKYQSCSVLWIPATDTESLRKAYLDTAQQLNITGWDDKTADAKRLVQLHLSKNTGRWLLIFDNADNIDMWIGQSESEQGSTRLIDFLPRSKQGCIIFTTRDRKTAVKLAHQNVVEVPEMDEDVATQLLQKRLINPDLVNGPDNKALLKELTYLPLAIVQAAAYINENGTTFAKYLALLADQEEEVIDLLSEDFKDDGRYDNIKNPVATTWLISFDQIRYRDPLAADCLSFMACIDSKDIPQSLLPIDSSRKKETAIGTLDAYSFITRRSADLALDLHRLVHLTTRNWLRGKDLIVQWTEKAIAQLDNVFPDHNHQNRSVWRTYLPHVGYVLMSDVIDKDEKTRIDLAWRFGMCLYTDKRYNEAVTLFTEATRRRERVLGVEHPDTLTSMGNLASTYRNQGRWKEAEELEVQVIETMKRVLGVEHPDTLTGMGNLASTYRNQGHWKEAEELGVQVMETMKRVLGVEHLDMLTSIGNLASTYRNQGRWKEAEELEVQVMETRKRVLGVEHPDTLTSIGNLASTFWNQGRWKEAEELEVQVMEMRKRVLGVEHPDTLTSMGNLASTFWNQGRWKEAKELGVQVMETRKRVLGVEHPDTLTSMGNLASTYRNQGRWKEAEELEVQVIETRKRVLGVEHPDTLSSMGNLASTYRNQGRWKEAEELGVQVIEMRKRVLGVEHPNTLTSMNNLAFTWKGFGRDGEALKLMEECVAVRTRVLGTNHPYTLSSREALLQWQTADLDIAPLTD